MKWCIFQRAMFDDRLGTIPMIYSKLFLKPWINSYTYHLLGGWTFIIIQQKSLWLDSFLRYVLQPGIYFRLLTHVARFSAINHSVDWLFFWKNAVFQNPMGNPSGKPVSPESSIDFRRGFPMDFLWIFPLKPPFSYGFPMVFPLKPPFSYGFPSGFSIWQSMDWFNEVSDHQDVELLLESFGMQLEAQVFVFLAQAMKKHRIRTGCNDGIIS